jgi:hypothetical protein
VRLPSGVQMRMVGRLSEFTEIQPGFAEPSLEAAVTLHANPKIDLDFTLDRGRVYLTNDKAEGPVTVRLRFREETWSLTLIDRGSEVGINLSGWHTFKSPFGSNLSPHTELHCCLLKGHAQIKVGTEKHDLHMPGPCLFSWDNEGKGAQGPISMMEILPIWNKTIARSKKADEMKLAVDDLGKLLAEEKSAVAVTIMELLNSQFPRHRMLGVWCLGALDDLPHLLNALDDQEEMHSEIRRTAIHALRQWLGRGPQQDNLLYNPTKASGALIDRKYTAEEADTVMLLLHDITPEQENSPEMYDLLIRSLKHTKLPIRELAISRLWVLVPAGRSIPFNPAGDSDQRLAAYEQWKKLIPDGKLPPRAPVPPPGGGAPQGGGTKPPKR